MRAVMLPLCYYAAYQSTPIIIELHIRCLRHAMMPLPLRCADYYDIGVVAAIERCQEDAPWARCITRHFAAAITLIIDMPATPYGWEY